jgi:hypothetical protein
MRAPGPKTIRALYIVGRDLAADLSCCCSTSFQELVDARTELTELDTWEPTCALNFAIFGELESSGKCCMSTFSVSAASGMVLI